MLGGKGKGGRVGQRESPSGTEVSPCLRVANLQKIFFFFFFFLILRPGWCGGVPLVRLKMTHIWEVKVKVVLSYT
jgi:hypothetical protein